MSARHALRHANGEPGRYAARLRAAAPWCAVFAIGLAAGWGARGCANAAVRPVLAAPPAETPEPPAAPVPEQARETGPDLFAPVREAPERFRRNAHLPDVRENEATGGIDLDSFSAGRDLVRVDDPRCWWESDNDAAEHDTEDDHSMNAAIVEPFRRLVNLAAAAEPGYQLRVQECYRAAGVHAPKSLHCEGRALDLTFERLEGEKLTPFEKVAVYESLAKLCWQAGFDWVYYEQARGTGPHVHASVRRLPSQPPVPPASAAAK